MKDKITPNSVVTTTTTPATKLTVPIYGTLNVPPIRANPTAKETITPVNQITKFNSLSYNFFFAIMTSF